MHKFKVGNTVLINVKSYKFKDKSVKIVDTRITDADEPYYMVTGEGILGKVSVWEHELKNGDVA